MLLSVASSCVKGLPAAAAEWDLSAFVIEGQPVTRPVVVAWLNVVYSSMHAQPFEAQEPPLQHSAAGLAQLLAFADAVGSARGILVACVPPLQQLHFLVISPSMVDRRVRVHAGQAYQWAPCQWSGAGDVMLQSLDGGNIVCVVSVEDKAEMAQQLAAQLEALLFLAHKLRLPQLIEDLHGCVRALTGWDDALLSSGLGRTTALATIMSARVLRAAGSCACGLGARGDHVRPYVDSIVTQACGFASSKTSSQVFSSVEFTGSSSAAPIKFKAQLTEDVMGLSKGRVVSVELDLFDSRRLKIDGVSIPVQLLIGRGITDAEWAALQRNSNA